MNIIPGTKYVENYINNTGFIISLIIMYQGLFGGIALKNPPKIIKDYSNNQIFRFITLTSIAYTATRDIETAIGSVLLFIIILYLLRTPEERKANGDKLI